jgi:hypothetical protein
VPDDNNVRGMLVTSGDLGVLGRRDILGRRPPWAATPPYSKGCRLSVAATPISPSRSAISHFHMPPLSSMGVVGSVSGQSVSVGPELSLTSDPKVNPSS